MGVYGVHIGCAFQLHWFEQAYSCHPWIAFTDLTIRLDTQGSVVIAHIFTFNTASQSESVIVVLLTGCQGTVPLLYY